MILTSPRARESMLDTVAVMLEGAHLELLDDDGALLVELGLIDPGAAIDRELVFKVADGTAVSSGEAKFARAIAADGAKFLVATSATKTAMRDPTQPAGHHPGRPGEPQFVQLLMP